MLKLVKLGTVEKQLTKKKSVLREVESSVKWHCSIQIGPMRRLRFESIVS